MRTIIKTTSNELIIEKSRFIAILCPLASFDEGGEKLKVIRSNYPKARHYCVAYIYDERSKCSDDGEPHGTAGRPMLEVLSRQQLNRVLLVVIRYFGGIKLGAGRLLSTYVESASQVINKAEKYEIGRVNIYEAELCFAKENMLIANQNNLQYCIIKRTYHDKGVSALIESREDIKDALINVFEGNIMIKFIRYEDKLIKEEGN